MPGHDLDIHRDLRLRFVVDSHDESLSASEFRDLFTCADDYAQHIIEREILTLLDGIGVPTEIRLATVQRVHEYRYSLPSAEVVSVHKGSWVVELLLAGPLLLFILKKYIHPVVESAFNESRVREAMVTFLRDRVFGGAKKAVETRAVENPSFGNLRVTAVKGEDDVAEPLVEVRLSRQTVIEVRSTDRELMDDFIRRLGLGQ